MSGGRTLDRGRGTFTVARTVIGAAAAGEWHSVTPLMRKPHEFHLVPHVGIGPLRLGMMLAEADAAVGKLAGANARTSRGSVHYFSDAALQFELGESGRVQFVGLADHPRILCRYHGQDVFDIAAPDLFALVAAHEK